MEVRPPRNGTAGKPEAPQSKSKSHPTYANPTLRTSAQSTDSIGMITDDADIIGLLNNITEESPTAQCLPSLSEVEEIATALDEVGIDPAAIMLLSELEPKEAAVLLRDLVVEGGRTYTELDNP